MRSFNRCFVMVMAMVGFLLFGSFRALAAVAHPVWLVAGAPLALLAVATGGFAVQTKILAIAAVIYALLQTLKKVLPDLAGGWALTLNVTLAFMAVVVVIPPSGLFSLQTLMTLVSNAGLAAAVAAGIHGTARSFAAPVQPAPASRGTSAPNPPGH